MAILELRLGDVVELRKLHPCGGREWTIIRLGADIGLRCRTCQHRVLIDRVVLERRIKRFVERGPEVATADAGTPGRGAIT
jgi:hypothetical protein